MFSQQKHFTIKSLEFDLFCGMDVEKKRISVTFVSHDGFEKQLTIPYDSANLIAYVHRRYPDKRIAFVYEAGPVISPTASERFSSAAQPEGRHGRTVATEPSREHDT